jgi:RNA polymerase sigma-70 factor (sigma-E family)
LPFKARTTVQPPEGSGRFGDLYMQHGPEATKLAFLLTGDAQTAQDLVQEAFVRLLGRFRHLRSREAFGAYLRRAVVNLAKNHWRKRAVERRFQETRRTTAYQPDPGERIATQVDLWEAISGLPFRQRAAVVFRYYLDMPERDIAEYLLCPVGTVKSLLSRARADLAHRIRRENHAWQS